VPYLKRYLFNANPDPNHNANIDKISLCMFESSQMNEECSASGMPFTRLMLTLRVTITRNPNSVIKYGMGWNSGTRYYRALRDHKLYNFDTSQCCTLQ